MQFIGLVVDHPAEKKEVCESGGVAPAPQKQVSTTSEKKGGRKPRKKE